MKIAMVSAAVTELPEWVPPAIAAAGIDLDCKACVDAEDLVSFAGDAEVIWLFGPNRCVTSEALERLPRCRALFRSGSGLDSLPLEKAAALGIGVHNTPESIAESVAEHSVALLLSLARQVVRLDGMVRGGRWESDPEHGRWHLSRRCLGLVGYGRIARHVENMLGGFKLKVNHHDPLSPESVPLDTLLREADFISLHCPLTPETRHLIDRAAFARMKPGALLVNTSRGPVVDEKAMIEALQSGHLGGAALDVLDREPPSPDNPLLRMDNVILTPHIAAFSADFEHNFWHYSIDKLKQLAATL